MDINSSVNPSESAPARIDLNGDRITFQREPPPPYTNDLTVNTQPVVRQTVIIQAPLKSMPMFYNCHKCGERVLTKVEYFNSRKTHLLAGFIGGFTFWCMLCCLAAVPYLVKTFKKAHHYCPNCDTFLGAYSRI